MMSAKVDAGLYPLQNHWRVGRKGGRTIYAQIGPEPSDDDVLIGVMDTRSIAQEAVSAHNRVLDGRPPRMPSGYRYGPTVHRA